jgi:hypothetical protein
LEIDQLRCGSNGLTIKAFLHLDISRLALVDLSFKPTAI